LEFTQCKLLLIAMTKQQKRLRTALVQEALAAYLSAPDDEVVTVS